MIKAQLALHLPQQLVYDYLKAKGWEPKPGHIWQNPVYDQQTQVFSQQPYETNTETALATQLKADCYQSTSKNRYKASSA